MSISRRRMMHGLVGLAGMTRNLTTHHTHHHHAPPFGIKSLQASLAESGAAWTFQIGNAPELRRLVDHLCDHPEEIAARRDRLSPAKSIEDHAREIDQVYASVLRLRA